MFLKVPQELIGAGELAVEAHFVAEDVEGVVFIGNGAGGDMFAAVGLRTNGPPGVFPIGDQLFFAYGHISPLRYTSHLLGRSLKNH